MMFLSSVSNFHFIRPWYILFLMPLSLMLFLLRKKVSGGSRWRSVVDQHLLPHLLMKKGAASSIWPIFMVGLIWFLAIFSLAGPTWKRLPQPVYRAQSQKIILLDLSPSMLASDISPNRLTRAKYKIDDILKRYREGQTGMVVFSKESYTVSPLTNDTKTIAAMMPVLTPGIMPVAGSSIGVGLKQAEKLLKDGGAKTGTILLVTDSKPSVADNRIVEQIHRQGYTISVLGVGTKVGAPIPDTRDGFFAVKGKMVIAKLDINALKKLAKIGGGQFSQFTNDDQDIKLLLNLSSHNTPLTKANKTKATTGIWQDEGQWFIFLLLPLVLIFFRRGILEELYR